MARARTYNVGHLTERLLLHELRQFVLTAQDIDGDEGEGDVLFFQHNGYALAGDGISGCVESQNHIVM